MTITNTQNALNLPEPVGYKAPPKAPSAASTYKAPPRKLSTKDLKIDLIVDEDFMTLQDLAVEARHLAYVTKNETDYMNNDLIDARTMLKRHIIAIERLTGEALDVKGNDFIWVSHGWEGLQGRFFNDTLIKSSRLSLFLHQHKETPIIGEFINASAEENFIVDLPGTTFKLAFDVPMVDRTLRGMTIRDHARYLVIPV